MPIVVFDFDDTLMGKKGFFFPKETKECFKKLHKNGIEIKIATYRPSRSDDPNVVEDEVKEAILKDLDELLDDPQRQRSYLTENDIYTYKTLHSRKEEWVDDYTLAEFIREQKGNPREIDYIPCGSIPYFLFHNNGRIIIGLNENNIGVDTACEIFIEPKIPTRILTNTYHFVKSENSAWEIWYKDCNYKLHKLEIDLPPDLVAKNISELSEGDKARMMELVKPYHESIQVKQPQTLDECKDFVKKYSVGFSEAKRFNKNPLLCLIRKDFKEKNNQDCEVQKIIFTDDRKPALRFAGEKGYQVVGFDLNLQDEPKDPNFLKKIAELAVKLSKNTARINKEKGVKAPASVASNIASSSKASVNTSQHTDPVIATPAFFSQNTLKATNPQEKLMSLLGDAGKLSKNKLMELLDGMSLDAQLEYLEKAFLTIKNNESNLYGLRSSHRFLQSYNLEYSPKQLKDIHSLKLAYKACIQSTPYNATETEYNAQVQAITEKSGLIGFNRTHYISLVKDITRTKDEINSLVAGEGRVNQLVDPNEIKNPTRFTPGF